MSRTRAAARPPAKSADRRLLEQQRLAMIGCLTAGLGHDIRNAVMPALLRADALSASPDLSESARTDLDGIRSSIVGLQHLATGLRLLSQEGRAEPSGTNLAAWWRDVGPLINASLSAGTQLQVSIPEGLPSTSVPTNLLAQASLALTMNARIWMQGAAAPSVSFSAFSLPQCVYITVRYCGEPTEFKRWSPDDSLDLPDDTPVEGLSGLGLRRVRILLEEHGGDLQLNEIGTGYGSFTLKLPILENKAASNGSAGGNVQLHLNDPRQLAVARLILVQQGLKEWRPREADAKMPDMIVCDRVTFDATREYQTPSSEGNAPRVIVLGVPDTQAQRDAVIWVAPSQLGSLADALR